MSAPLDPAIAEEMRRRAQGVRDRMANSSFTKTWSLSGKNSIVEPGRDVITRLMPRWDYGNSMVLKDGVRVPNPGYKVGRQFVVAYEHWWEVDGGKTTREWCPRTFNPESVCPICAAAKVMRASGVKEDREFGKRIEAREVFIYNAVVGDPRRVQDDGLVDIRPVSLSGVVFNKVSDIMTGGEKPQFARGDITNPREGFDICLKRPQANSGERWDVTVAGVATPLYGQAQGAAFKGWVGRMTDLEEMVRSEMKTIEQLYKAFYGRDPKPEELLPSDKAAGKPVTTASQAKAPQQPLDDDFIAGAPAVDGAPTASAGEPDAPLAPDDDFMPPAVGSRPVGARARR